MICLDTNYLVCMLLPQTQEASRVERWLKQEEKFCTSAVCWYEFLCGPVAEEKIRIVRDCLEGGIIPFSEAQIAEAARLFNSTGRLRRLRMDSMIAACAITIRAPLATSNTDDFDVFQHLGLKLFSSEQ